MRPNDNPNSYPGQGWSRVKFSHLLMYSDFFHMAWRAFLDASANKRIVLLGQAFAPLKITFKLTCIFSSVTLNCFLVTDEDSFGS